MSRPATAGSQRPVITQPAPDKAPAARSSGSAQQATQATAPNPASAVGSRRRVRSETFIVVGLLDDGGERDRTAGVAGTFDDVFAASGDGGP